MAVANMLSGTWPEAPAPAEPVVFDRPRLEHHTMQDQALAEEILGLFLAQLPSTLTLLEQAAGAEDWKFAAHALKGSAAAVGAQRLQEMAAEIEAAGFPRDGRIRGLRLQALRAAAAEFREAARRAYPARA